MMKESLTLNILFAVISGICYSIQATSTAYVAHLERLYILTHKEAQKKNEHSTETDPSETTTLYDNNNNSSRKSGVPKWMWILGSVGFITFNILGWMFLVISSWFGPVSINVPVCNASVILTNTALFSYTLKIDPIPSKFKIAGICKFCCENLYNHFQM